MALNASLAFLTVLQLAAATTSSFQERCLAFDPTEHVTNTTLRIREYVPANSTILLPGMDPSCSRLNQTIPVAACRIALTIPTSNRSSFIYEHFFPEQDAWTGRLLATGNGGIDGCIKYEDIAYGLEHGFTATGTNNGHNGTGGTAFLNNEEIVKDFSYRTIHTAAEAAKVLTKALYDKKPSKSYYTGCSGGGRQGIQAADLYPKDFDGILVGAPGINFNYMSAWRASFFTYTGAINSSSFISAATWEGLIHDEMLKQCDELDGVQDGILVDPALCVGVFQPETLLCSTTTANTSACLTPHQVEVVRKVFTPLYGESGELIYPPLSPGAETVATQRLLSGTPFSYSVDWYRYAVYSNPAWDPASWTIHDATVGEEKNVGNARSWPSDLSPLRDNGGKMLIFHGGADQQITGLDTERWYNYLSRSMDATSDELDAFMRFFRIPGMNHCSGGTSAWQIGQSGAAAQNLPYEAGNNVLAALVDWVEKGEAPDTVMGTKFVDDNEKKGVALTRKHCRYPLRSTYVGGDSTLAASWVCR
ncbi:ferulic acid esterase [Lophiotrema nucula]|uniref:Carboxylic ester hydrolase n=1 Tax=Lophiotrema nucula TaxID=690887 RepID=A0A6A5Z9T3_9PLEO|nr:ferulic acid esterase [Lophiotrema nucula]